MPVRARWVALVALAGCVSAPVEEAEPRAWVETAPVPTPAQLTPSAQPAPPLPALEMGAVEERFDGRPRIESLEAVNEDIRTVLRGVADRYGLGYQIHQDVSGRVTARLRDATLTEALDALLLSRGFTYQLEGDVLRVEPARIQSRLFSLDFIALSRVGVGTTVIQRRLSSGLSGSTGAQGQGSTGLGSGGIAGGGADVISTVQVTDLWEDIRMALEALVFPDIRSPTEAGVEQARSTGLTGGIGGRAPQTTSRVDEAGRRLIVNPSAGTILVAASPATLEEVEVYLSTFESAIQRQVRIEAKFVEVLLDREHEFGIDWGLVQSFGDLTISRTPTSTGGVEFTLGGGAGPITAVLNALDTQGSVRVLSSPGVSTMNNQRAVFNVTTEEVFLAITRTPSGVDANGRVITTSEVDLQPVAVGIVMDVLPQISADNHITMNVRPMVTSLTRVEEFSEEGVVARAPVVDRRELDTVVRVRSGETHVIGGLIQTREEIVESGVPFLKDIPLLGRLFRRTIEVERKGELVIFITPTVIAGPAALLP